MAKNNDDNKNRIGNIHESKNTITNFLLQSDMIKGLIQMADIQYTMYLRFLDLVEGDIEAAEKQTFIFMKALNAGNKPTEEKE